MITRYEVMCPGFESRLREINDSLLQIVQTASGAHPTFYLMGTGFFLGLKRPGCDVDHSSLPSAEVKDKWSYTSASHVCLHGVERDDFTIFCSLEYTQLAEFQIYSAVNAFEIHSRGPSSNLSRSTDFWRVFVVLLDLSKLTDIVP